MKTAITLSTLAIVATTVLAAPSVKTFKIVGDRLQYRNLVTVESESDFETFTGKTTKVSGTITYDFTKKTGRGAVEVDVASIETGIPLRDEHMRGANWLDSAKYPTIRFVTTNVKSLGGDRFRVAGNLTMHGVTRPVVAMSTVRYRAEGAATRAAGFTGDVVQLNSKFKVRLSDYGIKIPAQSAGKVAPVVTLGISAYAVGQ
jgi:polyisoprenoid-binding protein YceI